MDATFLRAAIYGLALMVDLIVGDPPGRFHPVALMGQFIAWWKARAPRKGPFCRSVYGVIAVLIGTATFTVPIVYLLIGIEPFGALVYVPIAGLLLACSFSISGLLRSARLVITTLRAGDLSCARRLVGWHLVSRDTRPLDETLVAAAVVESVAENVTDSVVSPLLYFLVAGVPGAWAYRFLNTCDSMLGYRDPEHEHLGKFAAWADDVLNWLPARLTGFLIVLASCITGRNARAAWETMWTQHGRTASPNAGWTMSAMAGALGVTLEKLGVYRLEGGERPATTETIKQARMIAGVAIVLFVVLVVGVLGLRWGVSHGR